MRYIVVYYDKYIHIYIYNSICIHIYIFIVIHHLSRGLVFKIGQDKRSMDTIFI